MIKKLSLYGFCLFKLIGKTAIILLRLNTQICFEREKHYEKKDCLFINGNHYAIVIVDIGFVR